MISSIRARTLAFLAPQHRIRCRLDRWSAIIEELARRSAGRRESGAFLLGHLWGPRREILAALYYDDLAPASLRLGAIDFPGSAYGALWDACRNAQMQVVADIHTHPGRAIQSGVDAAHPMIATPGHLALILPHFARAPIADVDLGIYEYLGKHQWADLSGSRANRVLLRTVF